MAGTGGCESRDEDIASNWHRACLSCCRALVIMLPFWTRSPFKEEVEPMHAWLQSIRMHLEATERLYFGQQHASICQCFFDLQHNTWYMCQAAELREVLRQSDERQKQLQAELQESGRKTNEKQRKGSCYEQPESIL